MSRSQESFNKKAVRNKKEKKRKEKEQRRLARKENEKSSSLDDMIAYVDENGVIMDTPPDPEEKQDIKVEDIEVSIPKADPSEKEDSTRRGTVSFFNESKGYGFIRDLESRDSIFVHVNNTLVEIKEGNLVYYETEKGPKGLTAINVRLEKEKSE